MVKTTALTIDTQTAETLRIELELERFDGQYFATEYLKWLKSKGGANCPSAMTQVIAWKVLNETTGVAAFITQDFLEGTRVLVSGIALGGLSAEERLRKTTPGDTGAGIPDTAPIPSHTPTARDGDPTAVSSDRAEANRLVELARNMRDCLGYYNEMYRAIKPPAMHQLTYAAGYIAAAEFNDWERNHM